MSRTTTDINRRSIKLHKSKIREVLPEHHVSEYPNLVTFLEKYYDFLDSDEDMAFAKTIHEMWKYRDLNQAPAAYLDLVIKEIGLGLLSADFFIEPRYATRLLSTFHRVKGSLYSAEGFFRAFYGVEAEIEYPKNSILYTFSGDSADLAKSILGPEGLRYLQDGQLYQIYSILVKSELPYNTWGSLYKKLLHPAGFYLGSEVRITGTAVMAENDMPGVTLDSAVSITTYTTAIDVAQSPTRDITSIGGESAGSYTRFDLDKGVTDISSLTITELDAMYQSIRDITKIASPSFDEDSDAAGRTMDMSNTIEKFDEVDYTWYDSV